MSCVFDGGGLTKDGLILRKMSEGSIGPDVAVDVGRGLRGAEGALRFLCRRSFVTR